MSEEPPPEATEPQPPPPEEAAVEPSEPQPGAVTVAVPTRRRPPSLRVRALAVVAAAVAVVVGASALGRIGPRAAPPAPPAAELSGTWFCPHGGEEGGRAWTLVANPGARAATVRFNTFGRDGVLATRTITVPPGTHRYQEVPAGEPGAGTQVEYFEQWVAASTVLARAELEGVAASRCVGAAHASWYVPDGTTAEGQTSFLLALNPFASAASMDVVIRTDRRLIRPGPLNPLVVEGQRSVAVRLNDYVLQAQDEHLVAVDVSLRVGRVVAGGLGKADDEARVEAAVPAPATRWVLPSFGDDEGGHLVLAGASPERADLTVTAQGPDEQIPLTGFNALSIGAGEVRTFRVPRLDRMGALIVSSNGVPVVVGRRLASDSLDPASVNGAARPTDRWLALPAGPPAPGDARLLIQNAGTTDVRVQVEPFGVDGPVAGAAVEPVVVPGGRTITVSLPRGGDGDPLSAVVSATGGTIVVTSASYPADGAGFAATLAVPMQD